MKYFISIIVVAIIGLLIATNVHVMQCQQKAKDMFISTFKQVCTSNQGETCNDATFESIQGFYRYELINRPGSEMEKLWDIYQKDIVKCI